MEELKNFIRYKAVEMFGENTHITAEKRTTSHSSVHWHNYFEIEIVTSGEAEYMMDGVIYTATEGCVFLMTPVNYHSIKTKNKLDFINISFDEEMLTDKMLLLLSNKNLNKVFLLKNAEFKRLVSASNLLIHECETDGCCKNQLCEYIVFSLLKNNKNNETNNVSSQPASIGKAILYLDLHFREDVTLTKLAEISGFNATYFGELFRQVTGETFTERLTNLRINYSKTLLKNGFSVTDACFSSGFGSLSNFLAVFKRKCGITPSQYKSKHK